MQRFGPLDLDQIAGDALFGGTSAVVVLSEGERSSLVVCSSVAGVMGVHERGSRVMMVLAAALVAGASACGSDPAKSDPATSDIGSLLKATCGPVTFDAVPPDPDEFPLLDADAQAGLDELINGPTGVEAVEFAGDVEWSIALRSDDELVLLGEQQAADEPSWLYVQMVRQDGDWSPRGWGGCRIELDAPGFGPATVATSPELPPRAEDIELSLLINEVNCASGQAPVDREVVLRVTETAESVTILALVAPVEGDATCPSNPWHPVTVTLESPLGSRQLIDGHSYPTQPVTEADTLD